MIDNDVDPERYKELCLADERVFTVRSVFIDKNLTQYLKVSTKEEFVIDAFNWLSNDCLVWFELNKKWCEATRQYEYKDIYFGFGIDFVLVNKTYLSTTGLSINL